MGAKCECLPTPTPALNSRRTCAEEEVTQAQTMTVPCTIEAVQQVHKQAKAFTQQQLVTKPRDASDAAILPHIFKALAGDRPIAFGNDISSAGKDGAVHMLHALDQDQDANTDQWNLTLSTPPDWCDTTSVRDLIEDHDRKNKFEAEARKRIANSLHVSEDRVHIVSITKGSVQLKYTVDDLTSDEKEKILNQDVSGKFRKQFNTFQSLKISPALLALYFNLGDLDSAGNKDFGQDGGGTFQVGGRTYHQPGKGWVRYGLKVLGKYGQDDSWLTPFGNQKNWLRGFHGTKGAAKKIADKGFKASPNGKLGPGVYISPFIAYAEGYAEDLLLQTSSGTKNFKVVLQVAVEPSKIMKEGYPNNQGENQEWTVEPSNVRPYGLLIKEP